MYVSDGPLPNQSDTWDWGYNFIFNFIACQLEGPGLLQFAAGHRNAEQHAVFKSKPRENIYVVMTRKLHCDLKKTTF